MILLSNSAVPQKTGGQALVGGLDIEVCRNFFGSQVQSCEMNIDLKVLEVSGTKAVASRETSRAVFIRAPAVLKTGPSVTVLARVQARPSAAAVHSLKGNTDFPRPQTCDLNAETHQLSEKSKSSSEELMPVVAAEGKEPWDVAVAVRQGSLLATAFHPEFTPEDTRWHQYFVSIVREARASWLGKKESSVSS
jgi:5'-phosphate synthase pdxT subunit